MSGGLFTPFRLGPIELANRIVMAPMTRNRADADNAPHDLNAEYYAQRAGAGLIVTEGSQVSQQGMGYPSTPGIHSERQVAGWRKVTDAVHAAGGRIYVQLWHVGRISHPSLQPGGGPPVAPSAIRPPGEVVTFTGMQPFETPRALATEEIPGIVDQFCHGAECAVAAGFDGAEIHGANGYLLDQFTRDGANKRTDAYGGSVDNRIRLTLAVAEAVAGVWGADRVGCRISPFQAYNDMSDSDPEATFTALARGLGRLGLGYLHVVEAGAPGAAPPEADAAEFLAARHEFFARLRDIFPGALIVNAGYDRARGEAVIDAGLADLVSMGAKFLANPDLPRRLAEDAPLNPPDRKTFYGGGAEGYTDYPFLAG